MPVDLTSIFEEYLAENRGPNRHNPDERQRPNYGVIASLDGTLLHVELTFCSGSASCCYQWACHVWLINGKRWDWLRRQLAAHDITAPSQMELWGTCVIEEGAIFFDFNRPDRTRRGWYAFAPASAERHEVRTLEAPAES